MTRILHAMALALLLSQAPVALAQHVTAPAPTGSPAEAMRLGRRWLSHVEALLKD